MSSSRTARTLRRLLFIGLLVAAAGVYALWARPWAPKPASVVTETVTAGAVSEVLSVNGQIVPSQTADLAAPVAGQITEILVSEGDKVEKGQVLARLDDTIARAAADQAEAALEAARIGLKEASLARDRAKALGASISAQARDSAQFAYDKAEAQVTQLAAAHDQAVRQLAQYQVKAPIAGIVLAVDADAGQVVSTSNTLFSIGDMSPPLIETDVDEIYGSRIMVGQSARVAPVGSDAPIAATVSFVAPSVDTTTGGRTVRLSFDAAPAESLPSGQTMSVNIEVSHFDKGISVPRSALLDLSGAPYVYLDVGGKAEKQSVSVRAWPADRLIVTKGLTQGDALITNPHGLEPGMLVAVAPAP